LIEHEKRRSVYQPQGCIVAYGEGVSKATIYKHWLDKDALCLEVLHRLKNQIPIFETDDLRADLTALVRPRKGSAAVCSPCISVGGKSGDTRNVSEISNTRTGPDASEKLGLSGPSVGTR
jgi:AcrR family transcriptional regulator